MSKIYETAHLTMFLFFKSKVKNPRQLFKCIVGCIFNSVGFIISREIPWIIYPRSLLIINDCKVHFLIIVPMDQ
jgi:hypothetical protein